MNGEVTHDDGRIMRVEHPNGRKDVVIYSPAALGALNIVGRSPRLGEINPESSLTEICAAQQDEIHQLREEIRRQQVVNGTLAKAATALTRDIQRRDQIEEVRISKRDWGQTGSISVSADADEGLILKTHVELDGPEWDGRSE